MPTAADPSATVACLARARFATRVDPRVVVADRARWGAVARRGPGDRARRAEPGPDGPLVYEAEFGEGTEITVWGQASTPSDAAEEALEAAASWAGLRDDPEPLADVVAGNSVLSRALREVGEVRLSRTPRLGEALGRAVIGQLVQAMEANRSMAQVAARIGEPAGGDLWTWPTARQIGGTPSWSLRRCGISSRGARALHAGAVEDARLRACGADWERLDRRLLALPGVGPWTSAETRRALGDPDAISVGDYNFPALVGHVLAGDRDADDAAMLELLAPFAGQRGRVLELIKAAVARRLVEGPGRRAPRAALSAHRYW